MPCKLIYGTSVVLRAIINIIAINIVNAWADPTSLQGYSRMHLLGACLVAAGATWFAGLTYRAAASQVALHRGHNVGSAGGGGSG